MGKRYVPIQMHLHASHEPAASMEAHFARCVQVGIAHTFLTEHDTRMGPKQNPVRIFVFSEPTLFQKDVGGLPAGFRAAEGMTAQVAFSPENGLYELILTAEDGQEGELTFFSDKRHCDPLFDRLTVDYFGSVDVVGDAGAVVDFTLSVRPPDFTAAHLVYAAGSFPVSGTHTRCLPLKETENGTFSFPITANSDEVTGGLDNAFCTVSLRVRAGIGGKAVLRLRRLEFRRELAFEEDRREMTRLAETIGRRYGVTPYVTFEITGAGHHKNCYSTAVPVLDYAARDFSVTQEDAIAHVRAYGGIFCYNHPFTEWKRADADGGKQERYLDECAENLIRNRVFGATLMEVGFPSSKENFGAEYYLRLWDRLSLAGIFITGDGDSDNHSGRESGWLYNNNFCSFAAIEGEPDEEKFRNAFCSGDLFFGDPTKLGVLSLTGNGRPMGAVLTGANAEIRFTASGIRCEGKLRRIVNGAVDAEMTLSHGGAEDAFLLSAVRDFSFVRYEILDTDGRLTGGTNPIYLVADGVPFSAAPERRYP